jgi:methyltransferase (TIGR00027 family)
MPGITLHYVLRKRFIEEAVLASVTAGVTQVVVVGAGFDMLSWRLHKTFPETTFIEIDHPATSTIKGRAIGKTADNYHVVAVDLGEDDIETVLTDFTPFDSQQQTLYVCEGVLMYLDEVAVRKLFASINNLTGVGSRFVFSVAAPMMSTESNTTFLLDLYLRFKGEPLKWGLEQKHLEEFVSAQGYKLNKIADDVGLLAQYLTSPFSGPIHAGEYLALTVIE